MNLLETVLKRCPVEATKDALRLVSTNEPATVFETPGRPKEVWCMATTELVDDEGEVIKPPGVNMKPLMQRKAIYIDHVYSIPTTVGKLRDVVRKRKDNRDGWESHSQILDAETNETKAIAALADAGMLYQSIGIVRHDTGRPTAEEAQIYKGATRITRTSTAFEISFTSWPMNWDCQQTGVKSRQRSEHLRYVLKEGGCKENVFEVFRIPRGTVYYIG
jgi:hypothetical protein